MIDTLFQIANLTALAGWAALVAAPWLGGWTDRIAATLVPLALSTVYAGLVLAFWASAPGGFGSLDAVMALFTLPEIALAGWIHYLAFDLFVGAWIVRTAAAEAVPFALVIPCLVLTFLFGPAGFLAFSALRMARRFSKGDQA